MTTAERVAPRFFADPVRDYTRQCLEHPVAVLQAGCLAPLLELALDELAESGFEVPVTAVDDDHPVAREVLRAARDRYADVITGDLRTVPVAQRGYDVVYCAGLLERIQHVELVLDRLTGALRPGGLLLLRLRDRGTAGALLDRRLPGPARAALHARLQPGVPGPFPAVYEKAVSADGIASYALMRGLVIAARGSALSRPEQPGPLAAAVRGARRVVARVSRGRFGDDHDELLYVIRKPLDRFARVVLPIAPL